MKDVPQIEEYIRNRVYELYWKDDINCARTAIICLSELFELRPAGFSENNPPHMCENLTCSGIEFAYQYILGITKQ